MIAPLLIAAVTPLLVAATPAPLASPVIPEIGRVRANALCTALRSNIAPTIAGLMKNDEIIGAGHRALAKMGHDAGGTSAAAIDIDKLYLEQVETRLVHNLKVIDTILGDEKRFPQIPRTDDERAAVALKAQLLAVADSQRKALDLVSGTLATEDLGQMQNDISNSMKSATGQASAPQAAATSDPVSFIGTAGLPEYEPAAGIPTLSSKLSTLSGHTVYDQVNAALEVSQSTTAHRERTATSAVVSAVDRCRAVTESPAPAAPTAAP